MIKLNVSAANITVAEKETLTEGRVGLLCRFSFTDEWAGLAKTAVFDGADSRDVILKSDTVAIPPECLSAEGYSLSVGVYGKNSAGDIVIPTVYATVGKIQRSAYPSGKEPAEPTPDVVAQIQQAAANAEALARSVRDDADQGRFDGRDGDGGWYAPKVSQPEVNTLRLEFCPSREGMPAIPAGEIALPAGSAEVMGKNLDKGQLCRLSDSIENSAARLTALTGAAASLDDQALFGKSYRDIFVAANIVSGGDFESGFSDDWTLYNSPLISGDTYTSPGQSLKCFCSGTSKYISTPVYSFLPGHTYYLAYRIRVDRYVSGNCGVQTFKNTYHNAVTEGFVTVSEQRCYLVTGSGLTSKSYIGCFSSADADAYIDDVVILDLTALFGAPPLKEVMDELYGEYIELLTAGSTAEKSSEYVLSAKPLREYSDAECKAAFMERLNQRAAALGMADSVFANASGLTTESLSSCRDLLKLGLAACTSPRVMQALCTKSLTPTQKGGAVRSLSLSHLILASSSAPALTDYYPLLGGKGGSLSSPEIKNHLVFCEVGGKLAVLAMMGAEDADSLFACEKELCDMLANGAEAGENLTALQDHGAYAAMLVPENPEAYLFNYSPAQLAERSGAVAYNGAAQFIPASVTKVLTAIVAAELMQPWEVVTVAASDGEIGGSGLVFVEGDSFNFSDALAGMLLPSSNQMAEAIARTAGMRILDN